MTTLIIAEKPDACMHIAKALAESGLVKKQTLYGVDYYEFRRNKKKFIAAAAVGHLFNLVASKKEFPVFDVKWEPSYKVRKGSSFTKKYFQSLEELIKNANDFIIATDFDNEGTVIGFNILKFIAGKNDAKRMQFSTLAKPDLIKSYEHILPHIDWQNLECGLARHEMDFYYGINISKALTYAAKRKAQRFSLITAGRVQGPLLCFLAKREEEIKKFKPDPYWQLQATININGQNVVATYEKDKIWEENKAKNVFKTCNTSKSGTVLEVVKKEYKQTPPVPFNITSLQTEAYRLFGYTPQQTMQIAQKLYTSALISYPRTSSEKLPPQIGYKDILKALSKIKKYEKTCKELLSLAELKPIEGKHTDPAHEGIHATVETPKKELTGPFAKIYDLVCRRFFVSFGKDAKRESMNITIDINGHKWHVTGRRTIEKGWMEYYGPYAKFDEIILPDVKKGDKVKIIKVELISKQTSPPPRYSQAAAIKEMEKRMLGTRATRSAILQTLYDRGYIMDKSIRVTDLGLAVAKTLKNYVPDLVDEKLTRKFEKDFVDIYNQKKKREAVLKTSKKVVIKIINEIKAHETKIGKELGKAISVTAEDRNTVGLCNNCGGSLKVLFSPFTKKKFVGCTGYSRCAVCGFSRSACKCKCPLCGKEKGKCEHSWKEKVWNPKCGTGFPLPYGADVRRTEKVCEHCKTPIVYIYRQGKRPFKMCLEPKCKSKADWGTPSKSRKTATKGRPVKNMKGAQKETLGKKGK